MLGNYLDMVDMGGGKLRNYKVQRITPRFWLEDLMETGGRTYFWLGERMVRE